MTLIACLVCGIVGCLIGIFVTWLYFAIVIVGGALDEECCG